MKAYICGRRQPDGSIFISTPGELWGHGISYDADAWARLSDFEKDIVYDVEFDIQMDRIYGRRAG